MEDWPILCLSVAAEALFIDNEILHLLDLGVLSNDFLVPDNVVKLSKKLLGVLILLLEVQIDIVSKKVKNLEKPKFQHIEAKDEAYSSGVCWELSISSFIFTLTE